MSDSLFESFLLAEVRCPSLARPAHAKIQCSDWNYFQSKCNYLCEDGYRVPAGQNGVRVCSYTGRWRGGTPVCQGVIIPSLAHHQSLIFTQMHIRTHTCPHSCTCTHMLAGIHVGILSS